MIIKSRHVPITQIRLSILKLNQTMSPLQQTLFKPSFEPYPTPDVLLTDDEILDENYLEASVELFGENSRSIQDLVKEFKDAIQKEGLVVPGNK